LGNGRAGAAVAIIGTMAANSEDQPSAAYEKLKDMVRPRLRDPMGNEYTRRRNS
jgi:hydroxyethylthiazole kinase-like sugar kinase family protein